ncbi:MAG: 4-carboxymuconolactone decarboxylase [Hyphomicrobiaceae bacterium]|jgi:4-carboxymuconolactone decarboxylase
MTQTMTQSMAKQRIDPVNPPYSSKTQSMFDVVMPAGMEPLKLFRTLATNDRVFSRFMRAGILDKGPVAIRDRELVIHRTTALCACEYEWGVHVAAFGRPLGFSDELIQATVQADADDPIWTPAQKTLVALCDQLHATSTISDELWEQLGCHYTEPQLLELIYLVGMYHSVSFLSNALGIELEDFAERFPAAS